MRSILSSVLSVSLVGLLAACASSGGESGDGTTTPGGSNTPGGETPGESETKDPPLEAQPTCKMVTMGEAFGRGCSGAGTSSGNAAVLCEAQSSSTTCGADTCLYDRKEGVYDFYCASACTVGDDASCPVGFACQKETCGTGRSFCARRSDFTCTDAITGLGSYPQMFEGVAGETLVITSESSSGSSLKKLEGKTLRQLASWSAQSYASNGTVLRTKDKLLILPGNGFEIEVTSGAAKVREVKSTSSSARTYGVDKTGNFVALEGVSATPTNPTFAALLRRGADGAWSEVGPTKQRATLVRPLNRGFVGLCEKELCTSADGETFTKIALPSGVAFADAEPNGYAFVVAGASEEDFYLTRGGGLFHYAVRNGKGSWVEEGVKGTPPVAGSTSQRNDTLAAFADGKVIFGAWNATTSKYTGYVVSGGCWKQASPETSIDNIDLVKGAFAWSTTSDGICVQPLD